MTNGTAGDDRIDALFALPPEEFVAARDRLVKDLKGAGDTEASVAVRKLRRPTAAAWAVNRLSREAPGEIEELIALGETLRQAHAALLAGGDDAGVREATARRRKLVRSLTNRALRSLAGGEGQREAIARTLDAAVADPDAAEEVQAGRLAKELEAPSSFGAGLVFADDVSPAPSVHQGREEPQLDASRDGDPNERTVSEQAAAEARRQAELIKRLQGEVDRTSGAVAEAVREVERARHEVDRLRELLDSAGTRLRAAEDRERSARAAAEQARRDLESLDAS